MNILRDSQLVIFSPSTIVITFFYKKSCRLFLQTHAKFEEAKTGSGVGFSRLTAVCSRRGNSTNCLIVNCPFLPSSSC